MVALVITRKGILLKVLVMTELEGITGKMTMGCLVIQCGLLFRRIEAINNRRRQPANRGENGGQGNATEGSRFNVLAEEGSIEEPIGDGIVKDAGKTIVNIANSEKHRQFKKSMLVKKGNTQEETNKERGIPNQRSNGDSVHAKVGKKETEQLGSQGGKTMKNMDMEVTVLLEITRWFKREE